ncbi:hypothetical protein M404DRAFT_395706 [Pisolithus tinctorius Marx 270]|uniref:Uncharacterized protein n=1 Tax=Pisolithus tinctorius Marx 270 TaxID=870435 RepID=A0A0C3JFB9_PISTI|nr:hypothetical protein M404DRAFT_395706 [Pisolithus tinctorius Marx 270]
MRDPQYLIGGLKYSCCKTGHCSSHSANSTLTLRHSANGTLTLRWKAASSPCLARPTISRCPNSLVLALSAFRRTILPENNITTIDYHIRKVFMNTHHCGHWRTLAGDFDLNNTRSEDPEVCLDCNKGVSDAEFEAGAYNIICRSTSAGSQIFAMPGDLRLAATICNRARATLLFCLDISRCICKPANPSRSCCGKQAV